MGNCINNQQREYLDEAEIVRRIFEIIAKQELEERRINHPVKFCEKNNKTCYICLEDIKLNEAVIECKSCKNITHLPCTVELTTCGICRSSF